MGPEKSNPEPFGKTTGLNAQATPKGYMDFIINNTRQQLTYSLHYVSTIKIILDCYTDASKNHIYTDHPKPSRENPCFPLLPTSPDILNR